MTTKTDPEPEMVGAVADSKAWPWWRNALTRVEPLALIDFGLVIRPHRWR